MDLRAFLDPPGLPRWIRVLRDAVGVMLCIAVGDLVGALPYAPGEVDPRVVEVFKACFGTLGFALVTYHATSRRARHLAGCVLVIWIVLGLQVALGGQHPMWWVFELIKLTLMALLGGGLGRLFERLARD